MQPEDSMSPTNTEKAREYMHRLLATMSEAGGSDLFIAHDFPPSMKAHGNIRPLASQKLTGQVTRELAHSIMNDRQRAKFEEFNDLDFSLDFGERGRFARRLLGRRGRRLIGKQVGHCLTQ